MEKEEKTLQEIIRDEMIKKVSTVCREYCKYYDQCMAEPPDDYQEDNIWDECPLLEFYY